MEGIFAEMAFASDPIPVSEVRHRPEDVRAAQLPQHGARCKKAVRQSCVRRRRCPETLNLHLGAGIVS